ncbi:hypothetical protein FRX31_014225 [Thalictrum thalictroides]|uniref:B3 domain-containing protein n=1 Tax=Thalictrum thalictroides TaxID=46969 RepID=A0A7J6WH03_THATH|nr:hypothetical protein FRX31_014225 [Thalictrum thalictroides]
MMNKKEKHNLWDDLLVVTETDYKNVYVEGKQKPCDLISLLPREEKGENVIKNRNIGVIKEPTKVLISKRKPIFKNKGKKPMVSNSNKNEKNGVVEEPPKMPIPISEMIKNEIGGNGIQWLNKKDITESDVNHTQSRLYLPREVEQLLTEAEKKYLKQRTEKRYRNENEIEVSVVDPTCRIWEMTVRYWPSITRYVLNRNWLECAMKNDVYAKIHVVEVWSFRKAMNNKLCFALNFKRKESKGAGTSNNAYDGA